MSTLRVELFFDEEAGNWHYRVPALHINGGRTTTHEDAERDCLSTIAFAIEGDPGLRHRRRIPPLRRERSASSLRNKAPPQLPHRLPGQQVRHRPQALSAADPNVLGAR
jgi:hypothetical protein